MNITLATPPYDLKDIIASYNNCIGDDNSTKAQKTILKIKRDLVGLYCVIEHNLNLNTNANFQNIKEQFKELTDYISAELDYLSLACANKLADGIEDVIDAILNSKYADTQYHSENDYRFWFDHSTYYNDGASTQASRLEAIHSSDLAALTANLFVSSLDYTTIRNNNWRRSLSWLPLPNEKRSSSDLGIARRDFKKSRNAALKEVYDLFEFVNSLVGVLTKNQALNEPKQMNRDAKGFERSLRQGPNASCWINN